MALPAQETGEQPLKGKVALVTGASSGMGRATALGLARKGAKICCCDLKAEANPKGFEKDLEKTTTDLVIEGGGDAIFRRVDISNLAEIESAFDAAISQYGRLDILVNCAGFWAPFRPFSDEDDDLWAKMVAVNTLGTSKATRLALRQFLKQDVDEKWGSRGRVISISSAAGHYCFPGENGYSATKASVNRMMMSGAMDHARDSINMHAVSPGVVATGMARANFEDDGIIALMKKSTPWPRLGVPQDIANAVVWLCLPESQWITGLVLPVDGGMTLGVPAP